MKKMIMYLFLSLLSGQIFGQSNEKPDEKVKMEHAQIGIVDDEKGNYEHTLHPDAQWFSKAAFGMFIHWGIASIKEIDLSWPMMAGTQIGWKSPKMDPADVKKIMDSGDYFMGHDCKNDNSCITPNEYWMQAKDFNPKKYSPEKWIKAAKDAGMTYAVLTTRHHDGFTLWPSKYGSFSTRNYMNGRDLVKDFVAACRKYGLKVGLYYSGPDWYQNREFQSFMYYGLANKYPDLNIPVLDTNLHPRKTAKSNAEKEQHYKEMAIYVKGQVEELLTNYGKIDMIWFDGAPDIPKGSPAWKECITMDQIHKLQPGIVVSPRFFGYGDYKTFEQDKSLPTTKQNGWAELCTTITTRGWGITHFPIKATATVLNNLIKCRSNNTNMLLNFGPNKDGELPGEYYARLNEFAGWMRQNGEAIKGTQGLDDSESSSVPATAGKKHRYLFILPLEKGQSPVVDGTVKFKTARKIKNVQLLRSNEKLSYSAIDGTLTIKIPDVSGQTLAQVIDVELK